MADFSTQRYFVTNSGLKPVGGHNKVLLDSTQVVLCYEHDPWSYIFHPKHAIDTIRKRYDRIMHPPPPPETITLGELMTQCRYHPMNTIIEEEGEESKSPLHNVRRPLDDKMTSLSSSSSSSGSFDSSTISTRLVDVSHNMTICRDLKKQLLKKVSALHQLEKQISILSLINNFGSGRHHQQKQKRKQQCHARISWNSPLYRALLVTHPKFAGYVRFPSIIASIELQQYVGLFREEMNERNIWYRSAYVTIGRDSETPEEERLTYFVVGCEKENMKEMEEIAREALWNKTEYLLVVFRNGKAGKKGFTLV